MNKTKSSLFKKIINSSWFITLLSTMIGVIAGFYLTNYNEKRKLDIGKRQAIEMVVQELENNHQNLKQFNDSLNFYYPPILYVLSNIDKEELTIIIEEDSLTSFIQKAEKVFFFSGTAPAESGKIKVSGDFKIELVSNFFMADLSHIVWDTYKQSQFMNITSFDCLTNVEIIYDSQKNVDAANKEWTKLVEGFRTFMGKYQNLLNKQAFLLGSYKNKATALKPCLH